LRLILNSKQSYRSVTESAVRHVVAYCIQ